MKKLLVTLASLSLVLVLFGCSKQSNESEEKLDVYIEEDNITFGTMRFKTNMPDGTLFLVKVKSNEGEQEFNVQSEGQRIKVDFEENLSGLHSVKISTHLARLQPKKVREVTGKKFVNLEGDLLSEDKAGNKVISKDFLVELELTD